MLDGRWIDTITQHPDNQLYPDISVVTLKGADLVEASELIGCELRLCLRAPLGSGPAAGKVYFAATVVSNKDNKIHIHDPLPQGQTGTRLRDLWDVSEKHLSAVYDLRCGMHYGQMNAADSSAGAKYGDLANEWGWGVKETTPPQNPKD